MVTAATRIAQQPTEGRMGDMAVSTAGSQLPTFLCVGAQKAGTTTLHALLSLHPEIYLPPQKELQYFSLHYAEGLEWYQNCFAGASPSQCIGEITPYYLFHPYVAERIANDLGKIRIIILLRDPVARTLSHYAHAYRHGFETLPLEQALAMEPSRLLEADRVLKLSDGRHQQHQECSYLNRSLYRMQVQRYWEYFGRENVLIFPCERLFSRPWKVLKEVFAFLNVSTISKPSRSILRSHQNQGDSVRAEDLDHDLVQRLRHELVDSYQFASDELGWDTSIPWLWSVE